MIHHIGEGQVRVKSSKEKAGENHYFVTGWCVTVKRFFPDPKSFLFFWRSNVTLTFKNTMSNRWRH